ncbi:MAG: hypothetical protein ABF946_10155, partial [Acetobacter papayae]
MSSTATPLAPSTPVMTPSPGITSPEAMATRHTALALLLATGTVCAMDTMVLSGLLTPIKADLH